LGKLAILKAYNCDILAKVNIAKLQIAVAPSGILESAWIVVYTSVPVNYEFKWWQL